MVAVAARVQWDALEAVAAVGLRHSLEELAYPVRVSRAVVVERLRVRAEVKGARVVPQLQERGPAQHQHYCPCLAEVEIMVEAVAVHL